MNTFEILATAIVVMIAVFGSAWLWMMWKVLQDILRDH